jgi:hypothetical protein
MRRDVRRATRENATYASSGALSLFPPRNQASALCTRLSSTPTCPLSPFRDVSHDVQPNANNQGLVFRLALTAPRENVEGTYALTVSS